MNACNDSIPCTKVNTHKSTMRTQRTRMLRKQNTMSIPLNLRNPRGRGIPPSQKHDSVRANPSNEINSALCESLPAFIRVAVGLMGAHS